MATQRDPDLAALRNLNVANRRVFGPPQEGTRCPRGSPRRSRATLGGSRRGPRPSAGPSKPVSEVPRLQNSCVSRTLQHRSMPSFGSLGGAPRDPNGFPDRLPLNSGHLGKELKGCSCRLGSTEGRLTSIGPECYFHCSLGSASGNPGSAWGDHGPS